MDIWTEIVEHKKLLHLNTTRKVRPAQTTSSAAASVALGAILFSFVQVPKLQTRRKTGYHLACSLWFVFADDSCILSVSAHASRIKLVPGNYI